MVEILFEGDQNIKDLIPIVWNDIIGSGLDLYVQIPMHLYSLGIEKTLIKKHTSNIFWDKTSIPRILKHV